MIKILLNELLHRSFVNGSLRLPAAGRLVITNLVKENEPQVNQDYIPSKHLTSN